MKKVLVAVLAALAMLLSACNGSSAPTDEEEAQRQADTSEALEGTYTGEDIVDYFRAQGLSVPNPRQNGDGSICSNLNCRDLMTTDAISIYVFHSVESAQKWEQFGKSDAYRNDIVVLYYYGARTPEADRPLYENALDEFLATV